MKVDRTFLLDSFRHPGAVRRYSGAVGAIGLWKSEAAFFGKHLPRDGRLLDLGCGAGRTTFGLFSLGYEKLTGVDLSPAMIREARGHAARRGVRIPFRVGDALRLSFPAGSFEACLFSFNGLMQIPRRASRLRALREIRRVLAPGGRFVFTTHDRRAVARFRPFWRKERSRWRAGRQDRRLHEFGDAIFEEQGRLMFIHIPDRREILDALAAAGLERIEDRWRSDLARESKAVREFSAECRFWAARRT